MQALKSFFNYRIPLFLNLIIIGGILLLVVTKVYPVKETRINRAAPPLPSPQNESALTILRRHDFRFIQPLVQTESSKESTRLASLKTTMQSMIDHYRQQGLIVTASVYFMDLNSSNWFSINGSEKYTPGSLAKVPVIMSYFKDNEQKPGWLGNKIFFDPGMKGIPHQTFEVDPLIPGNSYIIWDLLHRVASTSDNNSTALINFYINKEIFYKLYKDLELVVPTLEDKNYTTTVSEYSRFFQVLFNSSWLHEKDSELILQWLTESTFNQGITRLLPKDIPVARKFGEYGTDALKQWHESGIVYLDHRPYLITIMTKGFENEKLQTVIGEISNTAFLYYQKPS